MDFFSPYNLIFTGIYTLLTACNFYHSMVNAEVSERNKFWEKYGKSTTKGYIISIVHAYLVSFGVYLFKLDYVLSACIYLFFYAILMGFVIIRVCNLRVNRGQE